MRVVYRGTPGRVRSSFSFGISGCVHGCVLAWVILGGSGPPRERAQSIYDREIRPYEKRIVWYSLQEKLPEIAPADTRADGRAARARVKAPQTMVAGARDDARPAPLIWAPEPEVSAPKEMPLPNVVAVTPKVVRPFLAPKLTAPVVPPSAPERHLRAAALLAPDSEKLNDPGEQLPSAVIDLMRDIGIPNGIGAVGYTEADIGDLVPGTMKQQRLLATCPRSVSEDDIAGIFARSIQNW